MFAVIGRLRSMPSSA